MNRRISTSKSNQKNVRGRRARENTGQQGIDTKQSSFATYFRHKDFTSHTIHTLIFWRHTEVQNLVMFFPINLSIISSTLQKIPQNERKSCVLKQRNQQKLVSHLPFHNASKVQMAPKNRAGKGMASSQLSCGSAALGGILRCVRWDTCLLLHWWTSENI